MAIGRSGRRGARAGSIAGADRYLITFPTEGLVPVVPVEHLERGRGPTPRRGSHPSFPEWDLLEFQLGKVYLHCIYNMYAG